MKKIKIFFILALVGILLAGCKGKEARVQKQLDLGSKYMAELDYESAIVALNKAIKIDPKNVDAYTMLAEVYEKSGRLDEARTTLEKVLDIGELSSKDKDEINSRIKNLEFLVTISKASGEYDEATALELSNASKYDIHYSIETENNRLVATDMKYTSPILLDEDGSYIVKAYTVDSHGETHDKTEVKYTIKLGHLDKNSWENIGNIYRYRGEDGKIVTGWVKIDESWYYFKDNGDMATGVEEIKGVKYYFGEDGVMLTGWQQRDGKWYYILDSGECSTGWKEIDGKWYHFADNGEMETNRHIDGYYVGADGVRTDIKKENKTTNIEDSDTEKLYRDVLTKLYTKHELEGRSDYTEEIGESMESREAKYTLLDVTGDGKAELIVYVWPGISSIYGVKDGKISLLLGSAMDDECSILNDNSIVISSRTHNAQIGGSDFVWYKYSNHTGKFEEYKSALAATNENYEGYNEADTKLYESLMNNVKAGTWEVANTPVTPENIASLK